MTATSAQTQRPADTLKREFNFGSVFAFSFAFISPIVALYGIFGLAISAAGPSFWWGFLLVFCGQLLVALVFAMLVSKWPLEGSIYQWTSKLLGPGPGWFAGWFYIWTLVIAMSTVALGAAGFIGHLLRLESPSGSQTAFIAFLILIAGTLLNSIGRAVLKAFMAASIIAEIIGSIVLGVWLLTTHRNHSLTVLLDFGHSTGAAGGYFTLGGPFLIAVTFIGFSFVGFESAGSIAEEVHEPRKNLPTAILFSIIFIAAVVMFSSLAIILATPENPESLPGYAEDPVYAVLRAQLGDTISFPLQGLFAIGFVASFLALQTSASRLIWAKARDRALPGSRFLTRLTPKQHQPIGALVITAIIGTVLFLLSNIAEDLYSVMVNFTAGGFYISFLFPLTAFLIVVLKKRWRPGRFDLGRWTIPVGLVAFVWTVAELVNIAWPRPVNENPWLDWSVILGAAALSIVGIVIHRIVGSGHARADTDIIALDKTREDKTREDSGPTTDGK